MSVVLLDSQQHYKTIFFTTHPHKHPFLILNGWVHIFVSLFQKAATRSMLSILLLFYEYLHYFLCTFRTSLIAILSLLLSIREINSHEYRFLNKTVLLKREVNESVSLNTKPLVKVWFKSNTTIFSFLVGYWFSFSSFWTVFIIRVSTYCVSINFIFLNNIPLNKHNMNLALSLLLVSISTIIVTLFLKVLS